nr:44 kda hemoglobin B1 chain {N-terminal} [slender vestimentifera gen. sp.1, Peptide Partial, 19 aa] [slender vestimentifera sp. 1]
TVVSDDCSYEDADIVMKEW